MTKDELENVETAAAYLENAAKKLRALAVCNQPLAEVGIVLVLVGQTCMSNAVNLNEYLLQKEIQSFSDKPKKEKRNHDAN